MNSLCQCGCGEYAKSGNSYLNTHHWRGAKHSGETKEKMRLARIGMKFSDEHRRNMSSAMKNNHNRRGKKYPMTIETRMKISLAQKGRKFSYEHLKNLRLAHKSVNKNGNRNPNWKGGISREPYSFEFNTKLKEQIKQRDQYICMNPDCWGKTSTLSVHHIDYDKKNCEELNLITLCMSCNSRANSGRNEWQRLYSEIVVQNEV